MKAILAFLLVAAAGINVHSYPNHDPFSLYPTREYERTALGDSIDKASLKLLKEAYKSSEDKNVIASPLGVMILLSLFSNGAGYASRQEISTALGGNDYKQVSRNYIHLSREFGNMNPDFLTIANKIYVQKGYALDDSFSKTARDYKSGFESIDFKNPQKAADTINKWSDENTKGHIKEPVSADVIDTDTVAGLFNVIFFQGHWHVPFEAKNTKDEDFHVDKQTTVKKPTMHLQQPLYYTASNELGARLVELPYKEKGFRMVIVLPNELDGLLSVLEKVSQKGLLDDISKLQSTGLDVNLHLPKFEIKSKLDLNDLLPKVGVTKIFQEAAPGIVKNDTVVVSKAFQEAFVKIDEEGATAGAFTGLSIVPVSLLYKPPPPIDFKIDRPFLFLILHNDRVLFAGTYAH